jgi:hypothetical protein
MRRVKYPVEIRDMMRCRQELSPLSCSLLSVASTQYFVNEVCEYDNYIQKAE